MFDLLKLPVGGITRYWLGAMVTCGLLVRITWGRYASLLLISIHVQSFLTSVSQCGHPICPEISEFQSVSVTHGGKKELVVKASAGVTFSIILTESGKGPLLCLSHLCKASH